MSAASYICAFRGRRDDYQVPYALSEANRLEMFITDAYATPSVRKLRALLPEQVRSKLDFRRSRGIPDGLVHCLWGTTGVEHVRHRLGFSPVETWANLDQEFSRAAEREARKTKANLFLYSPYAWEAFRASYQHTPRRVLFEYHPHPSVESSILAEDVARFPEVKQSYREATGSQLQAHLRCRIADAWKMADLVVCASSFTKQAIIDAGANPAQCVVIPYGVESKSVVGDELVSHDGGFKALFVGSGVQRKGLHHLLIAWKISRLPKDSSLTLVCRNLDPGLEALVAASPRTRLIRGTTEAALAQLYRESTLFVMPSLVEGFGQVYLEALSHGCPVLGTTNTCLPDLGNELDGVFLAEIANPEHLAFRLEELAQKLSAKDLRNQAQLGSLRFTWPTFRRKIQEIL